MAHIQQQVKPVQRLLSGTMQFASSLITVAVIAAVALPVQVYASSVAVSVGDVIAVQGQAIKLEGSVATTSYNPGDQYSPGDPNSVGGLLNAISVLKGQIQGVGGAVVYEQYLSDSYDLVRVSSQTQAPVSGYTLDDISGTIQTISVVGGTEFSGTRIGGTLTGGTAMVSNLRVDLLNKQVFADLVGTKAAVGGDGPVAYNLPNTVLWTIGQIAGPQVINPAVLARSGQERIDWLQASGFSYDMASQTFTTHLVATSLRVTPEGLAFFNNALGLRSTGQNAFASLNAELRGWGSIHIPLTFSIATVPEPASYAIVMGGLLVVGCSVRARRLAKRRHVAPSLAAGG